MGTATNERIRVAWRNESQKEQVSLKMEKAMRKVRATVSFDEGSEIVKESYNEWKEG